jgi:hypothetical protein
MAKKTSGLNAGRRLEARRKSGLWKNKYYVKGHSV